MTLRVTLIALLTVMCSCGGGGQTGVDGVGFQGSLFADEIDSAIRDLSHVQTEILEAPAGGLAGHPDLLYVIRSNQGDKVAISGHSSTEGTGLLDLELVFEDPQGRSVSVYFDKTGMPSAFQLAGYYFDVLAIEETAPGRVRLRLRPITSSGGQPLEEVEVDSAWLEELRRLQQQAPFMNAQPGQRNKFMPGMLSGKPNDWVGMANILFNVAAFSAAQFYCTLGIVAGVATFVGLAVTGLACFKFMKDWAQILRGQNPFEGGMNAGTLAARIASCTYGVLSSRNPACLVQLGIAAGIATTGGITGVDGLLGRVDQERLSTDELRKLVLREELLGTWSGTWYNTIQNGAGGCTYTNGGACTVTVTAADLLPSLVIGVAGSTFLTGIDVRNTLTCQQLSPVSNTGAFSAVYTNNQIQGTLFAGQVPFIGHVSGGVMVGTLYRNNSPYGEFSVARVP